MIPKNNKSHYKICSRPDTPCTQSFKCDNCEYGMCSTQCSACAVAARDKEWANYILNQSNGTTFEAIKDVYAIVAFPRTDFEALKKLAEE